MSTCDIERPPNANGLSVNTPSVFIVFVVLSYAVHFITFAWFILFCLFVFIFALYLCVLLVPLLPVLLVDAAICCYQLAFAFMWAIHNPSTQVDILLVINRNKQPE